MKTTIELPEHTFRRAKILAAGQGMTLKQLFAEALEEYLTLHAEESLEHQTTAPWMAGFGGLAHLSGENRRILRLIEEEFETLDSEKNA